MVEELIGAPMLDERGIIPCSSRPGCATGCILPQAEAAVGRVAAALTKDAIQGWDPTARFTLVPLATSCSILPSTGTSAAAPGC